MLINKEPDHLGPGLGHLGRFLGSTWNRQLKFSAYAWFMIFWIWAHFDNFYFQRFIEGTKGKNSKFSVFLNFFHWSKWNTYIKSNFVAFLENLNFFMLYFDFYLWNIEYYHFFRVLCLQNQSQTQLCFKILIGPDPRPRKIWKLSVDKLDPKESK